MTVDEIVVDMSEEKGRYRMGQAYVALSRVRTYEKLHIINYSRHQIRTSKKVHLEMKRLRKNKLPTLPKPLISEAYESNLCCGHLNVQGLGNRETGKYLDLLNETDIQQLDVLCLSETHWKSMMTLAGMIFGEKKKLQ